MKLLFGLVFLFLGKDSLGQAKAFQYDDYFYYRNHQYLQTSSILLTGASQKIYTGDTLAAINLINQAASSGMYDTGYITVRGSLSFIRKRKEWVTIKAIIEKNKQQFSDPASMEIVTSDIDRFWKLYPYLVDKSADEILMKEYIMKGSPGLRTFFEVRMGLRATNLITAVKEKNKYYESIRNVSLSIKNYVPAIRAAAKKLKDIYPASIFPPTTFIVANHSAFGTADGGAGQLIGVEFLCDSKTADTTQLGSWERSVIIDTSKMLGIVIHELIHIEQNTASSETLLARSINEGAADFITQLVLGYNLNSKMHIYGNEHEKELWNKFLKDKGGDDISKWLYNGMDEGRDYPADLGYYIGYKICEAYYDKAADKKKAVQDILQIQNFEKFLNASGYGNW